MDCYAEFNSGCSNTDTLVAQETRLIKNTLKVSKIVSHDRKMKMRDIAETVRISIRFVHRILRTFEHEKAIVAMDTSFADNDTNDRTIELLQNDIWSCLRRIKRIPYAVCTNG